MRGRQRRRMREQRERGVGPVARVAKGVDLGSLLGLLEASGASPTACRRLASIAWVFGSVMKGARPGSGACNRQARHRPGRRQLLERRRHVRCAPPACGTRAARGDRRKTRRKESGTLCPGSELFETTISRAPLESRESLRRMLQWARGLKRSGFVNLSTYEGLGGC